MWKDRRVFVTGATGLVGSALVARLLELGADPQLKSQDDFTALDMCASLDCLRLLRQAYAARPDAEIAAHLGEVLWTGGQQDEARKVWAEALANDPDSPILRSTLLRLTGAETL